MMTLRLANLFLIIFISLIVLTGCEKAQKVAIDIMPTDPPMDQSMSDTESIPVKLLWLIDYPEGGKDAYIAWVASIAAILQAPEEVVRIRSYDNSDVGRSPNRLVEFEFKSFLDAATYLNRPEIAAILEDLPNRSSDTTVHTYILRSDYSKDTEGEWMVKTINLVDYPLGGKEAYLQWVASISSTLIEPAQLKAIASYDNYYGQSPHRLVEFEFSSRADFDTYEQLEEIQAIQNELDNQTGGWTLHTFELRSDYVKQ